MRLIAMVSGIIIGAFLSLRWHRSGGKRLWRRAESYRLLYIHT